MRTLVMGGNRFIGLRLVYELTRRGHEVTVFNSHPAPLPPGVRRLHGDRRQAGVIAAVLYERRHDFDAVFDNTAYDIPDLEPMVELFRGQIRHFIFTSSIAVYAQSDLQPIGEGFPVDDQDSTNLYGRYGAGKVRCENYLLAEHRTCGFPITILRVGHTCGPHNAVPQREPSLFARLELGRPILIPGDGLPLIHPCHVDDIADALASVVGNEKAIGQVYNAAGPEAITMIGWVKTLARIVGVEPRIVHVDPELARKLPRPFFPWREWDFGSEVFSIEKAKGDLHWTPKRGVSQTLRDAYHWFCQEGRNLYPFDFSYDDEVLALLAK